MTKVMYDSIDVSQFAGLTMDAAAGYVDGNWQTFRTLGHHVPAGTYLLSISVFGNDAECLDIESGDVGNAAAPGWVKRMRARYSRPVLYTGAINMAALENYCAAHGVPRNQYRMWSAHYTFASHFCGPRTCGYGLSQADGTQWTDQAHGRSLDQSVLLDSFLPTSTPPHQPSKGYTEDDPMILSFTNPGNGNQEVWEINPGTGDLWHRVWRPTSGWEQAVKMGSGYEGSPSFATNSENALQVYVMKKGGGVDHYWLDPSDPSRGWTKTSI
jgi:hypothetical protein